MSTRLPKPDVHQDPLNELETQPPTGREKTVLLSGGSHSRLRTDHAADAADEDETDEQ